MSALFERFVGIPDVLEYHYIPTDSEGKQITSPEIGDLGRYTFEGHLVHYEWDGSQWFRLSKFKEDIRGLVGGHDLKELALTDATCGD